MPASRCLHGDASNRHQPRAVGLEDRALGPAVAVARMQLDRDQAREVPRARAARLDDLDAALPGGRAGIDDRHTPPERIGPKDASGDAALGSTSPLGCRPAHRSSGGRSPRIRAVPISGHDRGKIIRRAEPRAAAVGARREVHRRKIDAFPNDPVEKEVADRGRGVEPDLLLSLCFGRRGDVRRRDLKQLGQRPVDQRLGLEDVEPGADRCRFRSHASAPLHQ